MLALPVLIAFYIVFLYWSSPHTPGRQLRLDQYLTLLRQGQIQDAVILDTDNRITGNYTGGPYWIAFGSQVSPVYGQLTGALEAAGVPTTLRQEPLKNLVGPVTKLGYTGPGEQFYNALTFRSVSDVRFGNLGRDVLTGPGIVNLNVSLFRSFSLTERLKMEFKAESFNFTNTPHFNNPSANVSNMSLYPDGTIRNLGNFMSITSANINGGQEPGDERQFRFGIRLSF